MKRVLLILVTTMTTACGHQVDVATAVQASVVSTGWFPAGSVDGRNKIVPSVSLTMRNVSRETLNGLQVNAIFRLISTNEEIGSGFRPVTGSGGLAAGVPTGTVTLKAARGYTGTDRFDELLKNSHFVDAKVELFVKAGSGQWTRVGEYPIARQFIGT
jgi:hypothetical protein